MKIALFVYNFPHKKSYNGLCNLIINRIKISQILAMNKIKLKFKNKPKIRDSISGINYYSAKLLADRFNIKYKIINFESKKIISFCKKKKFDLGIILGARILNYDLIKSFKIGILNMHPGLLPFQRGLDCHKYAILNNMPQGASVHIIDKFIDKGIILLREKIKVDYEDSVSDIFFKLQEKEQELMIKVLKNFNRIKKYKPNFFGTNYGRIDNKNEKKLMKKFLFYKKNYKIIEKKIKNINV